MAKEKEELNLKETKVEEKKVRKKKTETVKKAEEKETKKKVSTKKKSETPQKGNKKADVATASKKEASKKTADISKKAASAKKVNNATKIEKKTTTKSKTTKLNTKTTSSTTTNSSKKLDDKKINKVTPDAEKEKIKEETIIEKIKSFIAKIAAMQEEAKKENQDAKEEKRGRKSKKKLEKSEVEKTTYLPEYYDLPYRYNETVVKILAQTPKRIFVYWDIADEDILRYRNAFGDDFFEKTYPILLVHNEDINYTTEIPINDFANSWYIDINDPKTKYTIQLGRKFKQIPEEIDYSKIEEQKIILQNDYLPIAQSNKLEVPNNRILFTSLPRVIKFRNVKTYEEKEHVVSEIKTTYGKMYNIKEFYKENYKDEIEDQVFDLNNPSSGGLSSSSFR